MESTEISQTLLPAEVSLELWKQRFEKLLYAAIERYHGHYLPNLDLKNQITDLKILTKVVFPKGSVIFKSKFLQATIKRAHADLKALVHFGTERQKKPIGPPILPRTLVLELLRLLESVKGDRSKIPAVENLFTAQGFLSKLIEKSFAPWKILTIDAYRGFSPGMIRSFRERLWKIELAVGRPVRTLRLGPRELKLRKELTKFFISVPLSSPLPILPHSYTSKRNKLAPK